MNVIPLLFRKLISHMDIEVTQENSRMHRCTFSGNYPETPSRLVMWTAVWCMCINNRQNLPSCSTKLLTQTCSARPVWVSPHSPKGWVPDSVQPGDSKPGTLLCLPPSSLHTHPQWSSSQMVGPHEGGLLAWPPGIRRWVIPSGLSPGPCTIFSTL